MRRGGFARFLFGGPLFSIFASMELVRRDVVGLQDTVDAIAGRLSSISAQFAKGFDEVRLRLEQLEAQVAAGGEVDFTAVNAALDAVAGQVQSLDDVVPDTVSEPEPEPEPEPTG